MAESGTKCRHGGGDATADAVGRAAATPATLF